jgi:endonuclease YncB( thermonuclease family)
MFRGKEIVVIFLTICPPGKSGGTHLRRHVRPGGMRMKSAFFYGILLLFFLAGPTSLPAQSLSTVERVVDGDTIVLEDGRKVRLIGVDTPETVHPEKAVE